MDRCDKLKQLKDEISRLFDGEIDADEAYDCLRANPDFGSIVRRSDIHSFYKRLEEKNELKSESGSECETQELKIKENRLLAELKCMAKPNQDLSKFWLYDKIVSNSGCVMNIWQSRFLVTEKYEDSKHTLEIRDLFQNVSKSFVTQKIHSLYRIHLLSFPFVLFHEVRCIAEYFHLVKFDPKRKTLQKVQSFEYIGSYFVFVDHFDRSNFILKEEKGEMHYCKLLNGQLQIGERFDIQWHSNDFCASYFNNQLYSLQFGEGHDVVKILTYNLDKKLSDVFKLDPFPEQLYFVDLERHELDRCEWVQDRIFTSIQFRSNEKYGIAYTEPKTCKWTIIEFTTKIPIKRIQFVDGQNLMIYAKEYGEPCKQEVYKIPIRNPDLLRNMAWIKLVKKFKNEKVDDPYAKARQYLPLNSEIQPFIFFED